MSITTQGIDQYECAICGQSYDDERLVRAHISLSTDPDHAGRNGVMEDSVVYGIDSNGDVIEEIEGKGTNVAQNMHEEIPREAFPPSVTDTQLAIYQTAVKNHGVDNISDIEERVKELHDIDVSYQTVYRYLKEFFIVSDDDSKSHSDLTPKQQSVIDVLAAKPLADFSTVAEIVGVSQSYPSNVEEKYGHIVDERDRSFADDTEPSWTDEELRVISELAIEPDPTEPSRSYVDIASSAGVEPNVVSRLVLGSPDAVESKVAEIEVDTPSEEETLTDSPISNQNTVMSASPELSVYSSPADDFDLDAEDTETDSTTDESSSDSVNDILLQDIENLLGEMKVHRELSETQLEYVDSELCAGQLAITEKVETRLEDILEKHA